jgi:hypothetical protein
MTTISFKLPDDQARRLMDAASRQGVPAEEWLRNQIGEMLSREASSTVSKPVKKSTLAKALGLAKTESPPPDDEQVKYWVHDHKMEKFGGGLIP